MIGCYRIYPAWFARGTNGVAAGSLTPINELAHGAARRMGRSVLRIRKIDEGEDFRGRYVDFNVTYSASGLLEKSS